MIHNKAKVICTYTDYPNVVDKLSCKEHIGYIYDGNILLLYIYKYMYNYQQIIEMKYDGIGD